MSDTAETQVANEPRPQGYVPWWQSFIGLFFVFFIAGVVMLSYQVLMGLIAGRDPANSDPAYSDLAAGFASIWIGLLLVGGFLIGLHRLPWRETLGFRINWKVDIPLGIAAGVAWQFVVVWLIYLPVSWFAPDIFDRVGEQANDYADLAAGWTVIPFAVSAALIAPIVEELYFRGLLTRGFVARWGRAVGVIAPGVIFGVFHFSGLQLPALVAFGIFLSWLATRQGRLGACIVAHMAFNASTVVVTVLG